MAQPFQGVVVGAPLLTMYFQYWAQGWSEKYIMGGVAGITSPADVNGFTAAALVGCGHRARLVGLKCNLMYATLRWPALKHRALPVVNVFIAPKLVDTETTVEAVNDIYAALSVKQVNAANLYYTNRLFRGVRDSWIVDQFLIPSGFEQTIDDNTQYTAPNNDGQVSTSNAIKNFLKWLRENTVMLRKRLNQPGTFDQIAIDRFDYRGISKRDTGRPFGMSRGRAPNRT